MRWCLLLAAVISVALACKGAEQDNGAGGGSVCDGKATCNECLNCAQSNPCRTAFDRCANSSGCVGLEQCIQLGDGSSQSEQNCRAGNPTGVALYDAKMD